ncbi:MAG TPA: DUF5916 domain-containing protein, partial [Gemmatimonadales bacterium]|nr:DUF5916 domain-containing protein [Gemmatimonadales bacterium]
LRGGETGLGVMLTGMGRDLDASSTPYLHHEAWSGGVDFHHRFQKQYLLHGSAHWSRVTGSPAAIASTQRNPVHNYQRPDGAVALDTTRTVLTGDDEQLAFDKLGGSIQFQGIYTRRSPGFEVNDLGYLRLADQQTAFTWLGLVLNRPTRWYRSLTWNLNTWIYATTAGLVTDRAVNTNVHVTLPNLWRLAAWVSFDGLGSTFCDRCARGGPALRQDRSTSTWFDVKGDERRRLMPWVTVTTGSADGGRSSSYSVAVSTRLNASNRLSASLGARLAVNHDHTQWYGNPVDSSGRSHYTFAALDQRTVGVTVRADYTLSTTLSLQGYLQPFASWGTYRDVRELAVPRAASYADRFAPYVPPAGSPLGVSSRQLNANVVLRWEYRPGSTLFVVWSQARQGFSDVPGTGGTLQNLGGIFDLRADNTFLVKLSYWFNW